MKSKIILVFIFLFLLVITFMSAHPGSGIVIDQYGQIYFTDTGKGIWKIDVRGNLTFIPASRFHWMLLDEPGFFAESPKNFGGYFERINPAGSKTTLIMCSDFPITSGNDGNIYYAYSRPGNSKIIKRTPGGNEYILASNKIFEFANGIATGGDGSLYITESSNANANTIRKISMSGIVSIIATYTSKTSSNTPLETVPSYCRGIAIDSINNIYVAATGSRNVLKISPKGKIGIILQTQSPWTPTGVAIFHDAIYVLEWHDVTTENLEVREAWIPRVRKIDKDGTVTTIATISRK